MKGICAAKVGDLYRDKDGKVWIVSEVYDEPTVSMGTVAPLPNETGIYGRLLGGVSESLWDGFVRLVEEK